MLALLAICAALAGDLTVTTPWPVVVLVDGVPRPYLAGTLTVSVGNLVGDHRVDVVNTAGQALGSTVVAVPAVGAAPLAFDGRMFHLQAVAVPAPAPAPPPEPAAPKAMDEGAFARLLDAVKRASMSDDKVAVVESAAARNWFTVDQLSRLIRAMTFADDQVRITQVCAPKVVDPENAFSLGSAFTFSGDAERALAAFR
jgi:hypothetical protein